MEPYNPKNIESKWQKKWADDKLYETDIASDKEKLYVLDMFPYPSGEGLHVGHPKGYIATDIYSRMKKMKGFEVLHPMGWDAFGLPAEQFALKNKIHPRVAVEKNIARFKEQLSIIGFNYDWTKEINTTDPEFYKWTQWIFKQMWKKGLAYESNEPINWCPSCKTGLANEDLDGDVCERCGTKVEKKPLRQWVLKITEYADRMIADLDKLDWPEGVKLAQKNWIGRLDGSVLNFAIPRTSQINADHADGIPHSIQVFTTRADTLFGATFVAISAELAESWVKNGWNTDSAVKNYIATTLEEQNKENDYSIVPEKTGIFTGIYAINPATQEKIPVWIANYVIGGVGTGAIMAVPAHDERDHEFATRHALPIKEVVRPYVVDHVNVPRADKATKVRRNVHAIVYDPKTKKYLIIRNSIHKWDTVIIGGVEEGEDIIEAAKRELVEETGYTDVVYRRTLGFPVQAGYFAPHKDENRLAISSAVYFELGSDARVEIPTDGENEGNEILWVDESEFVPGKMINSELSHWLLRLKDEQYAVYTGEGVLINSGVYDGLSSEDARKKITEDAKGKIISQYKLKDWVFARQRYWGEPFPMVFDENHVPHAVADSELPVKLPEVEAYEPTGTGESPLAAITDWVNVYGYLDENKEFKGLGSVKLETKAFQGEKTSKLKENLKIEERKVIDVLIRDEDENFYILKDNVFGYKLVGGGIENGEDEIKALIREIKEETGFCNFTVTKKSQLEIIWTGFHEKKNRNLKCSGHCFEVLLLDNERVASEVEKDEHVLVKVNKDELVKFISWENHKLFIEEYLNNKFTKIGKFTRETNTMPQWAGSSWYYLRFADSHNDKALIDKNIEKKWQPVDVYVGGDHATRHLIYARFWHKFLYDIGAVSYDEPFSRLEFLGFILAEDGRKMSKRLGNVINPDDVVAEYGADALRVYEMFMAPFEQTVAWDTKSIVGTERFLERVWKLRVKIKQGTNDTDEALSVLHKTIKKVGEDIENFKFNTAISAMMICLNRAEEEKEISQEWYANFLRILAPFAPHMTEELWQIFGDGNSIHKASWPGYEESYLQEANVTIALQIGGKLRGTVDFPRDTDEQVVLEGIKKLESYQKYVGKQEPKKVIFVPNKLINIVI